MKNTMIWSQQPRDLLVYSFRRIAAVLLSLCAATSVWAQASSQGASMPLPEDRQWIGGTSAVGDPVDPARCKYGDKSYIYWAANKEVFRFKYRTDPRDKTYPMGSYRYSDGTPILSSLEVPPPPDPSEPEGCYLNPIRGGDIPYMNNVIVETFHKVWGRSIGQRTSWAQGQGAITEEGKRAAPTRMPGEKLFNKSTRCTYRKSGIRECIVSVPNSKITTWVLKIDANKLPQQSSSRDIYIGFWGALGNLPSQITTSGFGVFEYVGFNLSFFINYDELDGIIPFYSAIIQYMIDAHLPDYSWGKPSTKGVKS